jgi:hypothetical protein
MSRHFLILAPLLLAGCIETGLTMAPGDAGSAVDANDDTGEWTPIHFCAPQVNIDGAANNNREGIQTVHGKRERFFSMAP